MRRYKMTTRYHINHDGKIYPCRAKVLKCPYSESLHSEDKVELYYKLLVENKGEVEIPLEANDEIRDKDRLLNLSTLSDELEKSNSPVELIVHTLREGLDRMSMIDIEKSTMDLRHEIDNESEEVYDLIVRGISVPANVPEKISLDARIKFEVRDGGILNYQGSEMGFERMRNKIARKDYKEYKRLKEGLNEFNFEESHEWMTRDFERFTRDLNTSKMMTQPIFFGNLEQARETIKNMDEHELLSAYDDYSITNREIKESVKETNNFKYNRRRDLSKEANDSLQTWYDRNREIYKSWRINSSIRILLSIEIGEEIDRREVGRQDKRSVDSLLKGERKE